MDLFLVKLMINVMTLFFDKVNFPFLDGDFPHRASYGVYLSQLIRFARVCNHVADFNARNTKFWLKLRKTFSKFYRRHYELIFKLNVRFYVRAFWNQNFMVTWFTNYTVNLYNYRKECLFSVQKKRYRRIGYNLNVSDSLYA